MYKVSMYVREQPEYGKKEINTTSYPDYIEARACFDVWCSKLPEIYKSYYISETKKKNDVKKNKLFCVVENTKKQSIRNLDYYDYHDFLIDRRQGYFKKN